MNAPVRKIAISVLVLFTLLILNANVIQVIQADSLRTDPGNTRILIDEYSRQRGSIVVAGEPIATSVPTDDTLQYLRQYPAGPLYAPATGSYSLIFGPSAIERTENDLLAGSDDRLLVRRITDLFTGRDPKGGNVVLTLNPAAQQAAFDALQGVTGAAVALDPNTGAILAMVSTPSYDPNLLSSHDPAAIRDYAAQLDAAEVDPRLNRATQDNFPPGSIFKTIISAAALSDGYTPQTMIPAPDVLDLPGSSATLQNFGGETCSGSGQQSLIDALTISCNTAFAQLGITLGEDRVREMAAGFGIDGTGFSMPLPVVGSQIGDIESEAALAQSSVGQRDVRVTPMQAAMIASCIANDGQLMAPYLVSEVQGPDLSALDEASPEVFSSPITADVANSLTTMMVSVVDHGTGRPAGIDGVEVAGKTGTAQIAEGVNPHTWFIGFAPANDPQVAVAVFVANGGNSSSEATGGQVSAPIARAIMEAVLAS
ncbi:MAG: penicillin-binding protein 2 [Geodermatophilaceae bacterium]|nr:penicillin-binding protein 2 [Geodermatophilaceae bacterium]